MKQPMKVVAIEGRINITTFADVGPTFADVTVRLQGQYGEAEYYCAPHEHPRIGDVVDVAVAATAESLESDVDSLLDLVQDIEGEVRSRPRNRLTGPILKRIATHRTHWVPRLVRRPDMYFSDALRLLERGTQVWQEMRPCPAECDCSVCWSAAIAAHYLALALAEAETADA